MIVIKPRRKRKARWRSQRRVNLAAASSKKRTTRATPVLLLVPFVAMIAAGAYAYHLATTRSLPQQQSHPHVDKATLKTRAAAQARVKSEMNALDAAAKRRQQREEIRLARMDAAAAAAATRRAARQQDEIRRRKEAQQRPTPRAINPKQTFAEHLAAEQRCVDDGATDFRCQWFGRDEDQRPYVQQSYVPAATTPATTGRADVKAFRVWLREALATGWTAVAFGTATSRSAHAKVYRPRLRSDRASSSELEKGDPAGATDITRFNFLRKMAKNAKGLATFLYSSNKSHALGRRSARTDTTIKNGKVTTVYEDPSAAGPAWRGNVPATIAALVTADGPARARSVQAAARNARWRSLLTRVRWHSGIEKNATGSSTLLGVLRTLRDAALTDVSKIRFQRKKMVERGISFAGGLGSTADLPSGMRLFMKDYCCGEETFCPSDFRTFAEHFCRTPF